MRRIGRTASGFAPAGWHGRAMRSAPGCRRVRIPGLHGSPAARGEASRGAPGPPDACASITGARRGAVRHAGHTAHRPRRGAHARRRHLRVGSHREPQRGAVRHGSADHEAPCRPRTAQGTARGHAGPAGGRLRTGRRAAPRARRRTGETMIRRPATPPRVTCATAVPGAQGRAGLHRPAPDAGPAGAGKHVIVRSGVIARISPIRRRRCSAAGRAARRGPRSGRARSPGSRCALPRPRGSSRRSAPR